MPFIAPCFDYKGDVKTDGTYDILVKVENEMKKEFVKLIYQFKLKDELLKEIADDINELGDTV